MTVYPVYAILYHYKLYIIIWRDSDCYVGERLGNNIVLYAISVGGTILDVPVSSMGAEFDNCVAQGGKVRTLPLPGNKYVHTCEIAGKKYTGEVKIRKV